MRWILLVVLVVALAPGCSRGPEPVEVRARNLESQVWSPYCAGRLLSDCTTQQASDLRDTVSARLESGQSEAQVLRWLRQNYGDEILARPKPGASGLAVWLLPAAAILAGAVLLLGTIRRWSRHQAEPTKAEASPGTAADREYWIARVREEVERDL